MRSKLKAALESVISAEVGAGTRSRASEVFPFYQTAQVRLCSVSEGYGFKRLFGRIEASHRVARLFLFLRSYPWPGSSTCGFVPVLGTSVAAEYDGRR
jgi:hypothetical protein